MSEMAIQPDALFEAVWDEAETALARSHGEEARWYEIGGLPICVRFAGSAMVPAVAPAISHLEQPRSAIQPGLEIRVWDCESTGVESPVPHAVWNQCTNWGEWQAARGTAWHVSRLTDVGVYSMVDIPAGRAVYWAHAADQVPAYARAAALRSILHVWMRAQGRMFLHGAAVARDGKAALLVGRGGSGKSTTALLCAYRGWQYLGDDYCVASLEPNPRVFSLYNSAKLSPDQWVRFSRWTEEPHTVKDAQSGKAVVFLSHDPAVPVVREAQLRAILMPAVVGGVATRAIPDRAVSAWKAMAPSTMLQLPGAGQEDLARMGALAGRVPCYRLELGTDWDAIPGAMEPVLNRES